MTTSLSVYRDRRSGELRQDPVHAGRFLAWAYDTASGWLATRLLLSRPWVSRLYACWQRRSWTRRKILPFVARYGIDLGECVRPVASFRSFADFLQREIDLARRPVDPDQAVCTSPVDGRVLVVPRVGARDEITVKNSRFQLQELLADAALAARFEGGAVAVCRLYLADYHHFHFPAAGVAAPARAISGRHYAVTPYSRSRRLDFYARNRRAVTVFAAEQFGTMAIVEVGAFTVGSIRQCFTTERRVEKGARKGWFEFGGSTVVLVFRAGAIEFADDLRQNSAAGFETYVRMGDGIGRAVGDRCKA